MRNLGFVMLLCLLLVFSAGCGADTPGDGGAPEQAPDETDAGRIIANENRIMKSLDIDKHPEKAYIPWFYSMVETYKLNGIPAEEAIAAVAESLVREQALYEAAVARGLIMTEEEAVAAIEKEWKTGKDAVNYEEVVASIESGGVTIEEYLEQSVHHRVIQGTGSLYYISIKEQYMSDNSLKELSDSDEDWERYWEAHVQAIIDSAGNSEAVQAIRAFEENYEENIEALEALEQ